MTPTKPESRRAFEKRCDAVTRNFFVKPFKEGKMKPVTMEQIFAEWYRKNHTNRQALFSVREMLAFTRYYLEHEREAINS